MSDNLSSTQQSNNVQEGTTDFIAANESAAVVAQPYLVGAIASSYFPNDVQSVVQYLNKPVPITSGSWNVSATAATLLFNQDAWTGVFNNLMWRNKLLGFLGLRASLRVDVVLNATPFHQGRLRLCYYPCASQAGTKPSMHTSHRVPLSQLPGLDIGCGDTSISLMIPYVAPGRFIEITSAGNIISWGNIYLAVMAPLEIGAAGDSDVDYTVWYSMHDIQLIGQTHKAVAQSTVGKGKARRIAPSESEFKPLSHVLGAAADFSSSVAKIPLLSPWAGPVSWFLNAAKGAAISFGFSKPHNTEVPCLMSSNYNWYTTTSDGIDNSMPLALISDAKVRILDDVSDQGQDQMSIEFVKSQWSFLTTFTVAESNTLGQQLFELLLRPTDFFNIAATNEIYHTPVSYLSNLFSLYRGGLEIMLKFVKTGFHAGTLAVTYVPGPSDATITLTDTSYCYRTIVDLQEGDQACFRVPYLLPHDFIDTSIAFGRIYVHAVNPLRSPETCSNDFQVLVYVRGADSFQVQKPRLWAAMPITLQGGEVSNISEETVCEAPGGGPVAELAHEFCQESMSETARSLLQLIKRFSMISFEFSNSTTDNNIDFNPWTFSIGRFNTGTFVPFRQLYDPIFSHVCAPFAFYRGGVRIRTTPSESGADINASYIYRTDGHFSNNLWVVTSTAATPPVSEISTITATTRQQLPIATNTNNFGGLSVQVPYQNAYRMSPIIPCYLPASQTHFSSPRARVSMYTGTAKNRMVSRAVADDFQCLFWVGIPRYSDTFSF
jgi:hypothetical protein